MLLLLVAVHILRTWINLGKGKKKSFLSFLDRKGLKKVSSECTSVAQMYLFVKSFLVCTFVQTILVWNCCIIICDIQTTLSLLQNFLDYFYCSTSFPKCDPWTGMSKPAPVTNRHPWAPRTLLMSSQRWTLRRQDVLSSPATTTPRLRMTEAGPGSWAQHVAPRNPVRPRSSSILES